MIMLQTEMGGLKNFIVEIDEFAGVISLLSSDRLFLEPMTFRYLEETTLSIEVDYKDNRIQEIIFSYYKHEFEGFPLSDLDVQFGCPLVVIPEKKSIEKHMLYWNLDFGTKAEIHVGKHFVDIRLESGKSISKIYRDGVLDIFIHDDSIIGFRVNDISLSDLSIVKERLQINQNN